MNIEDLFRDIQELKMNGTERDIELIEDMEDLYNAIMLEEKGVNLKELQDAFNFKHKDNINIIS